MANKQHCTALKRLSVNIILRISFDTSVGRWWVGWVDAYDQKKTPISECVQIAKAVYYARAVLSGLFGSLWRWVGGLQERLPLGLTKYIYFALSYLQTTPKGHELHCQKGQAMVRQTTHHTRSSPSPIPPVSKPTRHWDQVGIARPLFTHYQ